MSRDIAVRMEYFVYRNAYLLYKKVLFCVFFIPPYGMVMHNIHFVHSLLALPYTDGGKKIREATEPLLFRYNTHTLRQTSTVYNCSVKSARFRNADFLKNDFPPTLVFLRFFRQ